MGDKCEVKNCRNSYDINMLGVKICNGDFEKFCDGNELNTKQGVLSHCQGTAVLREG